MDKSAESFRDRIAALWKQTSNTLRLPLLRQAILRIFSPQALFFITILTCFWFLRYTADVWQFDNCALVSWGQIKNVLFSDAVFKAWLLAAATWLALYLLTLLALPNLARNILMTIFIVAEAVVGLADFYMVVWYSCPMNDMVAILRATDSREIREYFSSMVYNGNLLLPTVLILIVVGLAAAVYFALHKLRSAKRCRTLDVAAGALVLLTAWFCDFDLLAIPDPLLNLVTRLKSEDPFLAMVSQTVSDPKLPPDLDGVLKTRKSPVFGMVIIGESDNRHHHSFYGYEKNTDVFLEKSAGDMIRFTDTVSATSSTIHSIFFMLTTGRIRNKNARPDYAVCEYFKELGIAEISMHDMQRSHGAWASVMSLLFTNADRKRTYADDGRNHYDGEVIENVTRECAESSGGAKLLFVHLMGSHYDQRYRVPDKWLDEHSAVVSGMDSYDRSIVYTGYVIDKLREAAMAKDQPVFVLYIPDHSEEPDSHRSLTVPDKIYYEIPMFLWFNAAYRKAHPEIVELARQAADKPFQTDLVLQLLARLMDVPAELIAPEEDLLSSGYKAPVRLIGFGELPYPEKTGSAPGPERK